MAATSWRKTQVSKKQQHQIVRGLKTEQSTRSTQGNLGTRFKGNNIYVAIVTVAHNIESTNDLTKAACTYKATFLAIITAEYGFITGQNNISFFASLGAQFTGFMQRGKWKCERTYVNSM